MQGAWRVGLLVVVFGTLFLGSFVVLRRSMFGIKSDSYTAEFSDAGGIASGTRVLMAGVRIGEIDSIELVSPRLARLKLNIDRGVRLPKGSTVTIPSSLIGLGENPLYVVPGPDENDVLPPGSTLQGTHASAMDNFFPEAKQTVVELNKTLASVQSLLEDQKLKGGLTKLMETSDQTIAEFGALAHKFGGIADQVNGLIGQNQTVLTGALKDARLAMGDIRKSTEMVSKMLADDEWKDKAVGLLDGLTNTTKKAEVLLSDLDAFVTDPKLREPLANTLDSTQKIAESGTVIAKNTEEITKNGITITEKAISLADKANDLADEAKGILEKFKGVLGKAPNPGMFGSLQANLDLLHESRPSYYRTDLSLSMPFRDTTIHVGLFDAFETNRVTLQLGKELAKGLRYRYGIYASKPGIGVDYQFAPRLFLRGDLFDINNPRGDLRARLDFGNGFYGWVGVNQVLKRNTAMIGFGIQK